MLFRASRALVPVLAVLVGGCPGGDASPLDWNIQLNGTLRTQTRLVVASVYAGEVCGEGAPLYSANLDLVDRSDPMEPVDELGAGKYAFYIEARSADCSILATKCQVLDLPLSDASITLVVDPAGSGSSACNMSQECLGNGLCRQRMIPDASVACMGEGTSCEGGSGTCHGNECCFGCWDGAACQAGTASAACGVGGGECQVCGAGDVCRAATCADQSTQPSFHLSPTALIFRDMQGRYWAGGDDSTFHQLGPRADDGGMIALTGYTGSLRFADMATCQYATCGLDADGALYCWGTNALGALALNSADSSRVENDPVAADPLNRYIDVEAGSTHFCAIKDDGHLYCWGDNQRGQLGVGSSVGSRPSPSEVATGGVWTQIATMSGTHTCAIRSDGALFCWGANGYGQIGDGTAGTGEMDTSADRNTPTQVGTDTDWIAVSGGSGHTCGIRGTGTTGNMYCWGRNSSNELGIGSMDPNRPTPAQVGSQSGWKSVGAGLLHTCGLIEISGAVQAFCWGFDGFDALGTAEAGTIGSAPVQVESSPRDGWTSIAASWNFSCGTRGGDFLCWGRNAAPAPVLGVGSSDPTVPTPTDVILVPAP